MDKLKTIYLLFALLSFYTSFQAQVLEGTTNEVSLKFGFPELQIKDDLQFLDENDNENIDPGEGSIIRFSIENVSKYPARNVMVSPRELNNIQGLNIPEQVELGDIPGGTTKLVQVGIASTDSLEKGTASLIFYVGEQGEESENISVVFAVGTAQK